MKCSTAMRRIITACAAPLAAVLLFPSCTRDRIAAEVQPDEGKVPFTIIVGGGAGAATRSTASSASDCSLNDVQVFIFNSSGALEASSGIITGTTDAQFSLIPGNKTVWAVANVGSVIPGVSSLTAFRSATSRLSDNTQGDFIMSGSTEVMVGTGGEASVTVRHIASKVVIDSIRRDFTVSAYKGIPLTIKNIYLSNVAGDSDYACSGGAPSQWFARLGSVSDFGAVSALIADTGVNHALADGTGYTVTHTFYAYPNPVETDSAGGTWSPRRTRLLVECDYNGRTCYYPVTLPAGGEGTLERNRVYHISRLTLTRPGSENPDDPDSEVSSEVNCTVEITVSDWDGDVSYTETF